MATTRVTDVITPEVYNYVANYILAQTAEQSALIASGAIVRSAELDADLAGGGLTFNRTFYNDLGNEDSNVSSDEESDHFTGGSADSAPLKTSMNSEVQIRMSRNQSWSDTDLAAALSGTDPMAHIINRAAAYWTRDMQRLFVRMMQGVFADNAAAPVGTEHVQDDMTHDISGASFVDGKTNIGSGSFIDATLTMGDAMGDLRLMMVHPIVYGRLQKQSEIITVPQPNTNITFETYKGRAIVYDDAMPFTDGVYESWLLGSGAVQMGQGSPAVPVETDRKPASGNGGGSSVLYNRKELCLHPVGHKYAGPQNKGGPSNADLANAASWQRAFPERKQIKMARLITREHA